MQESQHLEFKRQWKDDLLKWISAFANANAFFRAGLIESWGRGIERIMEACQQENYPAPEWEIEPGGLWMTFRYPEKHIDPLVRRGLSVSGEGGGANVGVNVGVNEVFGFIQENQPVNAGTIAAQFPQVTKRTVERWIKELRDQGLIEFKGASKTGGYFVIEG